MQQQQQRCNSNNKRHERQRRDNKFLFHGSGHLTYTSTHTMSFLPDQPLDSRWEWQFRCYCRDADVEGMARMLCQSRHFNATMSDHTNNWATPCPIALVCSNTKADPEKVVSALKMLIPFVEIGLETKLGEKEGKRVLLDMLDDGLYHNVTNPTDNGRVTKVLLRHGANPNGVDCMCVPVRELAQQNHLEAVAQVFNRRNLRVAAQ